jgi:tetratricopeptide (TPR) repeat protein
MRGKKREHRFEFPGRTGHLCIKLEEKCFNDVDSGELYRIGKLISSFMYGLLLEDGEERQSSLNLFHTILKDTSFSIEDKELGDLLRTSSRTFKNGDYLNALFISKLVLSRINLIIDEKLAHNDRKIDREIIKLQISTLNFIGYLLSKIDVNVSYGVKLATIARTLLKEFDESKVEIMSMKSAVCDTLGALYIRKKNWDKAIGYLSKAHEYDRSLIAKGHVDEIGIRLTCSNLGYALVQKCGTLMNGTNQNLHEIESALEEAMRYFNQVRVDKPPAVPDSMLKDLELQAAMKRMKGGVSLCEQMKKELQRRLL